jgi:membrane protein YdbS with pleckstrin-like domain
MYGLLRGLLVRLFRLPDAPPDPPPGAEGSVLVFRAARAFYLYQLARFLLWTMPWFLFVVAIEARELLTAAQSVPSWVRVVAMTLAALVVVVVVFVRYLLVRLDYDFRYYVVTDRSLRIRQGAWRTEEATYTFANVQNVSVEQGPVERVLGIANVKIETAGGGMVPGSKGVSLAHQGVLAGIADAEGVRDKILARLKHYRDAGLGDDRGRGAESMAPPPAQGFSADAVALLREVRDEAKRLEWAMLAVPKGP